jgi:hypothetical protein
MRKHAIWIATGLTVLLPATAYADEGVLAKVGLMGAGIEYVHPTTKFSAVRLLAQGGSLEETATESDIKYDFKLKLRNAGVIFDWHPFAGVFYGSAGLFYNKNELEANATGNGSVVVGGTTYTSPNLKGDITFQAASPYLGLGWGHKPEGKGFSMAFEIGVLYQGSPEVKFTSNSGVSQADLDREAADLEKELTDYKYYPQIALSIGYRF